MKPIRLLNRLIRSDTLYFGLVMIAIILSGYLCPATAVSAEESYSINRPIQITSRTEPVLDMAVSLDGRHIAYISGDAKPTTLWLASADPSVMILPQKLSDGPSVKSSPAVSANGRYVAYVDTDYDVKGDIYLLDLKKVNEKPIRLTDRKTEDGGPCFSPDGRFLYFHQAIGNRLRRLSVLDLKRSGLRPASLSTGGDAMFCAMSPDNRRLAFVSVRNDASGDIFIMNMSDNTIRQITGGPAIDMLPQWAADSRTLYFSRIGSDTNHDKKLSTEDHSIICRISTDSPDSIPYPVTPLNIVSFKPFVAKSRIYFLSNQGGVSNCWSVPEEGYIRNANSPHDQFLAAGKIANRIPYDPNVTLLAYVNVIENFSDNHAVCAKAGYKVASIFHQMDLPVSAQAAYQYIRSAYKEILPESLLAEIKQIGIEFQTAAESAVRTSEKQNIYEKSLTRLDQIALQYPGTIAAESRIESVTILLKGSESLSDLTKALDWLDEVIADDSAETSQKAQALFLKAQIYAKTVTNNKVIETYRLILINYPEQRNWVDRAVERIIDTIQTDFAYADLNEKIRKLNLTAIENQFAAPPLSMGALNRIGDLYYEADQLVQAKAAYQNVIDSFSELTTQTASARFSLAEILFREEQFRQAIDLYETEISLWDSSDRIYQLARLGYIRKNISAGEFLFRLGEIPSARSTFKELLDYDDQIIEAHRGYIKCAAVTGDIENVLYKYRKNLKSSPNDPVWLYCTGLCLSYLNNFDSAKEAKKLIEKSIRFNSSVEYFHQTLGYVFEVLETVYGETKKLEQALMSYQKAYFLNDHVNNTENAANLELNLGNIYYLMGQYEKAFKFYSRRQERNIEFADPNTQIVFYKRFGECAFQDNDIKNTITAFQKAIELIDGHIDPLAPSRAFDRLNRYLKDRIIDPAINTPETKEFALKIAREQSEQNLKVADLSENTSPPPSEQWQSYKEKMLFLVYDQEKLNKSALKLARKLNAVNEKKPGNLPIDNPRQNLLNLTRQITKALDFPERLIELKIEISDRLGLAYQDNSEWDKATEIFEKVFSLNEKTGNNENLARNRRSVAYNTYQQAKSVTSGQHIKLLKKASKDFDQVLSLIDQYSVPEPAEKPKRALIDISVSTSLDASSATQAAKGFSATQEKRLAETFISRIQLELGHLETSRNELVKQLRQYPDPESVNEKDRYGVSLLYHRAALLDNAVGNYLNAFEKFAFSAELCLKMENPASAAANITNMTSVGQKIFDLQTKTGLPDAQMRRLQKFDNQTADLLSKNTNITGSTILIEYHNILGVFYSNAAEQYSKELSSAVHKIILQQHAVSHFTRGLELFENNVSQVSRKQLETGTSLYLNMAVVARALGDEETAIRYYQHALKTSKTGIFPDLEWRALAGLGQLTDALNVLETVPISRAGCEPLEIIRSFGSLIFKKLESKNTEAALNLAEKISELERFNRLAPFVRPQSKHEQSFFLKLYPRLERIRLLKKEIKQADEDNVPFLQERLDNEQVLLANQMGADNENLPGPFKDIRNSDIQDLAVLLMSMTVKIEETADALANVSIKLSDKNINDEKTRNLARVLEQKYHSLVSRYKGLAEDAYYARPVSSPPDFIALMSPEPFEAMDLMDALSDDDAVARIFHTGIKNSPYAAFLITKEEITGFTAENTDTLKEKIDEEIDWITPYIANENPPALNLEITYPYALSAKHLARCINSRKPFKQKLLSVPQIPFADLVAQQYNIKSYASVTENDEDHFRNEFSSINTLLISSGPKAVSTVPTEPGEIASRFFAVYPDPDTRVKLEKLLAKTSNLSLSILSGNYTNNVYLVGHLFSIYGCPGIIFINDTADSTKLVPDLLTLYPETSGIDALNTAALTLIPETETMPQNFKPSDIKTDRLLYLGYQGMTGKESIKFAKNNFIKYVKTGRSNFDQANYVSALVMFENAISVASEISKYSRYLPDLYKFARESAYRSGNNEAALNFSKELVHLQKNMEPESKAHADALLRLGLMYSKKDNYEKAIPVIESAVHIMSQLPPDEDLIRAFMDLGIVLENATNYETALSRFKTAVDLSRTLNQSELMGEQYLNIGRVYDLRLNQYATAILNYEKALEIYTASADFEKIAESKLNIGRCYRLLGNFTAADRYYTESLELISSKAPAQLMIKVKILIEQANNSWFQGRYEEAFRLQRQCYTISQEQDLPLMQVISLNTEGLIWWTLGDYDKALEALNNALTDAAALKIRKDEIASTLNNVGLIFRDMGNYEKALETFEQAISIDTSIDSKWGLAYDYRNKGLTYLKLDQPVTAAELFDQAYSISTAIGNRINAAKAILGKGDALLVLKDYKGSQAAFQTALELSESMLIKETQWRALFGLARIQIIFYNDLDAAEKLLRKSVDVIEQLRSDIKVKELKENFISNKLSVYETLVKLLADKGQPKQAFEMAERSRARNFIDLLGNHQIGLADEADSILYKKQQILKSEIETTELLLGMSTALAERDIYRKSIEKLNHDLQNVMLDMQLQNPQLVSMVSVPHVDTEKLLEYLEPGTALLSYYLLEKEVFCWVLRSDIEINEKRLQLIRIPADRIELEKRILEFRRIIQNLEPYEKHAAGLYAQLFAPLMPQLEGVYTLGISPYGSLHYLSFATLYNEDSFLLDQFSLFYVPSAGVLEYTLGRRVARPYRSPRVLAIGNPDLGDPILDLPFAEQEVGSISWNFPEVTILTREKATEDWVINNISGFDIIHIASHGEFDPVNPLLSAIKLAGAKDKNFTKSDFDGNLEAGEIFGLKINADMVFLSACQTGLGKINAGDDVVGLNRSFFFAGTHTVVSSLWRVSDVSTAILIKTFYRMYMNKNKADCLKQAALHVKTRYPHPGYWGAFTLVGDYY
ncbi:MAG: tetratricopeptide repeat protein [Desulfobacteraceae bacterium]|nr:tetratricopeptide repeat protein [Desulfobacteraceae bacterium]MBC2756471.1 tetratricopeptide repeat protein [Desulfobacteraceae bacterium]